MQLHHLLLAAWLRLEVGPRSAQDRLREHGAYLDTRLRNAGLNWLARLARRALAQLLGETPAADDAAMPFFIGAAQDRWREALASIVALGSGPAGKQERGAAQRPPDLDRERRCQELPHHRHRAARTKGQLARPGQGQAGVAGHADQAQGLADARRRRAARGAARGLRQQPFLDTALAAAALVRHPHVAWASEPQRFIEVAEALPALEVMTRGEHIAFRLVDPLLAPPAKSNDDDSPYHYVSPREQEASERARQTLLIPTAATARASCARRRRSCVWPSW